MAYKDDYATGDTIDATTFNELVKSAVYSFADLSTIQSSITSPTDGQIAFAQDTESYYRYDLDSTSWTALLGGADITAVNTNANSGLSGGASSGAVTLTVDANNLDTATAVSTDYVVIEDVTDNSTKKALISDIISQGDITEVNTSATSGLNGGATSGAVNLVIDPSQLSDGSGITVDASNDLLVLEDATDGTVYKVSPQKILDAGGFADIGLIIALG